MSGQSLTTPYFARFQRREAPQLPRLTWWERGLWQLLASMTICFGASYIYWRWTQSLNQEALLFSCLVAFAETAAYLGTCLCFFDIWDEVDTTETSAPPSFKQNAKLVDIFITTLDEDPQILTPTIQAAQNLLCPNGITLRIWVLDDGNRDAIAKLCREHNVRYLTRSNSRGFKAGNLANALYLSRGDFFVICDADTQLFPNFLKNTLGYFNDEAVAWVQTPHWFYDLAPGRTWRDWLRQSLGIRSRKIAEALEFITGKHRLGSDPYLVDPTVFFDIIQRRRNRHGAAFCCGAGSIHRREAVMKNGLMGLVNQTDAEYSPSELDRQREIEPFKFHVSEDIFTSIQLHQQGWKSVYHPYVEARMLSPWSARAWAVQKLKYAGGTYDIMLNANPLFRRGLSLAKRLHYLATFWSYASVLWTPILVAAPAISLISGIAPVQAYDVEFFVKFFPVLLFNELALFFGLKGYDTFSGRCLTVGTWSIQLRALVQVIKGHKPSFPSTPKTPDDRVDCSFAKFNILLIGILLFSAAWGAGQTLWGAGSRDPAMLYVNLFWTGFNALLLGRVVIASLSNPSQYLGDTL